MAFQRQRAEPEAQQSESCRQYSERTGTYSSQNLLIYSGRLNVVPTIQAYYQVLESHCEYLKTVPGGGVGWFAHIYSDDQENGYGIYDLSGHLKFPFSPKTHC